MTTFYNKWFFCHKARTIIKEQFVRFDVMQLTIGADFLFIQQRLLVDLDKKCLIDKRITVEPSEITSAKILSIISESAPLTSSDLHIQLLWVSLLDTPCRSNTLICHGLTQHIITKGAPSGAFHKKQHNVNPPLMKPRRHCLMLSCQPIHSPMLRLAVRVMHPTVQWTWSLSSLLMVSMEALIFLFEYKYSAFDWEHLAANLAVCLSFSVLHRRPCFSHQQ